MFDNLGGAFEGADFTNSSNIPAVPLDAELEIFIGIKTLCVDAELSHVLLLYTSICPAICWSLMITNSAGLSGAKPTTTLTMPRLMSFCVVVSLSHLTK